MANHGLTDLMSPVTISKSEYEQLVRDSEQLSIITNYVKNCKYASSSDIKVLLDVQEEKNEEMECETDGN